MNIVLLGAPGAGKGTLAKQLEAKYGYYLLSPGNLYREEAAKETEFGLKARAYWAGGNLCPDEMTNALVKKTVEEKCIGLNTIFDGYPRTREQAKFLDTICNIELVLNLTISDDTAIARLLKRKEIENRPDDTEEAIRQRLVIYHTNNQSIVAYYKETIGVYSIKADGSIKETFGIAESILKYLQ